MNYYYLISGLPDLHIDNAKTAPALVDLLRAWEGELAPEDMQLLNILRYSYDNRNLLAFMANRDAALNLVGTLTTADWIELFALMDEAETPHDNRLKPYMLQFYRTVTDEKSSAAIASKEDLLTTLYYDYAAQCGNRFLAAWFEFQLNLNNVLTAVTCRKHGFDLQAAIIGDNELAQRMRSSSAADFGLKGLMDDADRILAVAEDDNILTREHKIDALKWAWLEEHTFFDFFGVEHLLAYWLQCELLQRWRGLSIDKGRKLFSTMLDTLKQDVKF